MPIAGCTSYHMFAPLSRRETAVSLGNQRMHDGVRCLQRHDLAPLGRTIDVAMPSGERNEHEISCIERRLFLVRFRRPSLTVDLPPARRERTAIQSDHQLNAMRMEMTWILLFRNEGVERELQLLFDAIDLATFALRRFPTPDSDSLGSEVLVFFPVDQLAVVIPCVCDRGDVADLERTGARRLLEWLL